jgi:hypothetical protein
MSDRRRFLKGLTLLPLATILANPRLAAAVSAGLQEVEAKLADGRTVKGALAVHQGQANVKVICDLPVSVYRPEPQAIMQLLAH